MNWRARVAVALGAPVLAALVAMACSSRDDSVAGVDAAPPFDSNGDSISDASVDADADAGCEPSTLVKPVRPLNILMVTKETLFFHDAAHEAGDTAVPEYLRSRGHTVTVSPDSSYFGGDMLAPFDVVMFFVTSGNVVTTPTEQDALMRFVHSGKGIVGTHTATATNNDWLFMYELMGATFGGHGAGDAQITQGQVDLFDPSSPLSSFLPDPWVRTDEWYFYDRNPLKNSHLRPLIMLDEPSIEQYGGYPEAGIYGDAGHPLAWTQDFECSRVFYTALGHTGEAYAEPLLLEHIAVGTEWAGAPASLRP